MSEWKHSNDKLYNKHPRTKKRDIRLIIPSSPLSARGLRVHLFWKYFENCLIFENNTWCWPSIYLDRSYCLCKNFISPTNFVCLLFSYCFKCLYIFYISDGSGRRYCLFKNIHFPSPISFASFLVIILINYYFLILATVQADTIICAQISFPPPISFASFKVVVLINYYFYIKNQYFNSTLKCY